MHEWRFLSKTAVALLPAQQPKTQSVNAARSHYEVLGFMYYGSTKFWSTNYVCLYDE